MITTLGDRTAKKYRGKMASGYYKKRVKQERWMIENETVEQMLKTLKPKSVLDMPFGEGRFIKLHREMGHDVVGVDSSGEMLALANKKLKKDDNIQLITGDARSMNFENRSYDVVVCVRFLDLIDEASMWLVLGVILRAARRGVICTIRLGEKYVCKSNTATHDEKKFRSFVTRSGFKITRDVPVFNEGWHILQMERVR